MTPVTTADHEMAMRMRGASFGEVKDLLAEHRGASCASLSSDLQEARAELEDCKRALSLACKAGQAAERDLTEAREQLAQVRRERDEERGVSKAAEWAHKIALQALDAGRDEIKQLKAMLPKARAFDAIAKLTAEFGGADFASVAADIGEIIQRAEGAAAPTAQSAPSEPARKCLASRLAVGSPDRNDCGCADCAPSADVQAGEPRPLVPERPEAWWREKALAESGLEVGAGSQTVVDALTTELVNAHFCMPKDDARVRRAVAAIQDFANGGGSGAPTAQPRAEERVSHLQARVAHGRMVHEQASRDVISAYITQQAKFERRARELCVLIASLESGRFGWEHEDVVALARALGELLTEPTGATTGETDGK